MIDKKIFLKTEKNSNEIENLFSNLNNFYLISAQVCAESPGTMRKINSLICADLRRWGFFILKKENIKKQAAFLFLRERINLKSLEDLDFSMIFENLEIYKINFLKIEFYSAKDLNQILKTLYKN